MKINQKYVIIMLVLLVVNVGVAQEQVDRNVTIEREFQPVIQDAGKITGLPEVLQVKTTKERIYYAEIYQPLPFEKNIVLLSAEEVLHQRRKNLTEAFIRLGGGNYWNTLGDISLPVIRNNNNRLDLRLNHTGTFGEKLHSFSRADLGYNHYFSTYDLYAGLGFSHQYFNYYGNNFYGTKGDTITRLKNFASGFPVPLPAYKEQQLERITRSAQTVNLNDLANSPQVDMLWRYNAHVGIRSLPNATGKKYHAELAYDVFKSDNGLQESILKMQYGFSNPLGENRFGMDFELSNLFYQEADTAKINFWDYYAVFSMNPYFLMERDNWFLRAGVRTAFSFIHGRPFNPTPDITAEWRVLPRFLSVYGGITGGFTLSTLNNIYAENPYVYSDLRVKDTYTPINTYAGFKLKPLHNLLLDAFLDYRYIVDQYFFVNKAYFSSDITGDKATLFTNRFNAVYSDAGLFRVGLRANYNYKNTVNIQLKGVYNAWDVKTELHAWMKPAIEANISADVRINRNLTASALLFYEGERYAKLGNAPFKMAPKVDVNLGATYTFNRTFSAFAKLNNLLNNKYQQFYGYEVQGINFMLGGAVSF
ncbi:MAG: hypothetical protein PHQ11_00150 [Paludibacter sp.]|nr:hypothetical protein [Paludibacter sp.]MDD4198270.1 hypothetical protein [Paludibacter sp.]